MKIIIGLGNPGEKYKETRHNIGFEILDAISNKHSQSKWIKRFHGLYCECWSEEQKFILLKPTTFMNNSGKSAASIVNFFKLKPSELIIIHDDLDLKIGQIKIKFSGGHAGHNGLKSIHQAIGDNYVRLRIGIGRPNEKADVSSYVLSKFTKSQNDIIETYKSLVVSELNALINEKYQILISKISKAQG